MLNIILNLSLFMFTFVLDKCVKMYFEINHSIKHNIYSILTILYYIYIYSINYIVDTLAGIIIIIVQNLTIII